MIRTRLAENEVIILITKADGELIVKKCTENELDEITEFCEREANYDVKIVSAPKSWD